MAKYVVTLRREVTMEGQIEITAATREGAELLALVRAGEVPFDDSTVTRVTIARIEEVAA